MLLVQIYKIQKSKYKDASWSRGGRLSLYSIADPVMINTRQNCRKYGRTKIQNTKRYNNIHYSSVHIFCNQYMYKTWSPLCSPTFWRWMGGGGGFCYTDWRQHRHHHHHNHHHLRHHQHCHHHHCLHRRHHYHCMANKSRCFNRVSNY